MVLGQELATVDLGAARLALVRHAAGQETPHHGHRRACLHIVLRGLYVEHSRAGTVVACPGDVVFKDPDVEHWNHFGSVRSESLRFELGDAGTHELRRFATSGDAADLERAARLGRGLRQSKAAGAAHAPRRVSPQTELLARLRRGFRDRMVLGKVAAEIGVHRSHLTRQFAREFGCSPQAYVASKRAAWAAEELAKGGETLAAIAVAAGFADQSHLTRTFKRVFGTTPARWCRELRG